MAIALTILRSDKIGAGRMVQFMCAFSGTYPTGGDVINFATATPDPNFSGLAPVVPSSQAPNRATAFSQGGNLVNDYVPVIPSPNSQTGWKLKICAPSSFGTEFSAGAYSAAILADSVIIEAIFSDLL